MITQIWEMRSNTRKHAKQLLREEIQWEAVRHLQRALGRTSNSGMDWIEVENANGM